MFSGGAKAERERQSLVPGPWPWSEVDKKLLILGALAQSPQLHDNLIPCYHSGHETPEEGIRQLILVIPVILTIL